MNRCLPLASLLAFAPVRSLSSQTLRDTAECRTILEAPTRDSQLVRIVLHVRPFDSVAVRMSAAYRELIGDAIKTQLKVPHPLALTAYDAGIEGPDGKTNPRLATLMLTTSFVAILHRDGRLTGVRPAGGIRNAAFEYAMLRAMRAASDSGLLPPASAPDVVFKGDSVAIRFAVQPDLTSPASNPGTRRPEPGDTPLLLMRLPARRVTQAVAPDGRKAPEYPNSMRRARIEGRTVLHLVVDETGKVDLSTIDVVQTPALDFVRAILEVLPSHHFKPLIVEGCPVPTIVSMPFDFNLTP
jgi:TonB family protein